MLHAPLRPTVAKLDISRLLESSSSPQSRPVSSEDPKDPHAARSASDPPPARGLLPSSKRSSVSSTHSGSDSYAALSASSLPPQLPTSQTNLPSTYQHHHFLHHHRPRIPSMSALPLPGPSLPPLDTRRHYSQTLSASSLPEPTSFSFPQPPKRPAQGEHPQAPPAKRQSKWTAEEDALVIELRGAGMKWEDISKRIPGRTPLSCRLHYQNYIERRSQWDEDRKNRLARLYERLKPEMWKPLAAELNVPWRAAEAMHWQLGQVEMARRAGVTPFSISSSSGGASNSRLETSLVDASPTVGFPPMSPYPSGNHGASNYTQSIRQGYFDERDSGYRAVSHGRARSVSASSGEERRGSGAGLPPASWTTNSVTSTPVRQGQDNWPLPRLLEVEDIRDSIQQNESKHKRRLSQEEPS